MTTKKTKVPLAFQTPLSFALGTSNPIPTTKRDLHGCKLEQRVRAKMSIENIHLSWILMRFVQLKVTTRQQHLS